jgi:hypothetical protein
MCEKNGMLKVETVGILNLCFRKANLVVFLARLLAFRLFHFLISHTNNQQSIPENDPDFDIYILRFPSFFC